jgi:preprotein translocase subunit SecA
LYEKLAGMTGTAATEAEEFYKIYKLEVVSIPTNKPTIRIDQNDLIYKTEIGKFMAVTKAVKELYEKGQPVLIGTISIEKNELLANFMEREGLRPNVLNAKNHDKEARIIADAGRLGAITIATNMAGRGVDIMLGGVAPEKNSEEYAEWLENNQKVKELGGLHVIGTERHESRRIDNQLRGRAGRQGDTGSSQFFVSMDDDLMRIFGGDRMKSIMTTLNLPEDMPIENRLISKSIESAQKKVEGNNFDIRKHLVDYDDVINKHREAIYRKRLEILSLYEINHSLGEKKADGDELRIKNYELKINGEEYNKNLSDIILTMVENEIEQVVAFHTAADEIKDWNVAEIYQTMTTIFPVNEQLKGDLQKKFLEGDHKFDQAKARTEIIEHLFGMAKNIYDELRLRVNDLGVDWSEIEKSILIRAIDMMWIEHLEAVASVRKGIGLRGYGQRDPLIEYKKEAFGLYNQLNNLINKEVVYSIYKIGMMHGGNVQEIKAPSLIEQAKQFSAPEKTMSASSSSFAEFKKDNNSQHQEAHDLVPDKAKDEDGNKIGRNDICPCGSGKKYKKCCGQ